MQSLTIRRACALAILFALAGFMPVIARGGSSGITIPADRLIEFLNQSISLYHQTTIQQQIATEPREQLLLYDNRQLATQSVQLAFQFARAQVDSLSTEPAPAPPANITSGSSQYSSLSAMLVKVEKQLQDAQNESNSDQQKLAGTRGAKRAQLQSEISELQGEIALAQARRDAVRNMREFVGGSAKDGISAAGLRAQIDALASSIPAAASSSPAGDRSRPAQPVSLSDGKASPSGIWDLVSDLFSLSSKLSTVKSMIADTNALLLTSKSLRAPFIDRLRDLSKQGDQLAAQADTADRTQLAQERQQLDFMAAQFKQLSIDVTPLSKQRVLLNLYQRNLVTWRDTVYSRYKSDLRSLAIRLGALALVLIIIFGLSEIWRRAVYRYVREPRRRYQFLLLRKLTLWFVIALVILLTFASKLGSFFTFAGLLTAGVAVALQNVILAMAGYFFLIGKFGIRVGDRIEVNKVVGEVVDIGLVRFHIMELGAGATPTGRVVAFSNSVVFQPTAGLFKQIPGASFAWHQVTLTVPREADFGAIKKSLLGAVEDVLRDYHESIEGGYHQLEKTGILMSDRGLRPKLELQLSHGGVDATIRYPVDLQHATDIDARVSRALLTALERDSKLQTPEAPAIQLKTDVPAGAPTG